MKIRQQRTHLLIAEPTGKGRHQLLARKNHLPNLGVCRRRAAWQRRSPEDSMEIGRDLLESQVVVFVAVCAAARVEVLALGLLRRELRRGMASGQSSPTEYRSGAKQRPRAPTPERWAAIYAFDANCPLT
jgi:hypothetical protein